MNLQRNRFAHLVARGAGIKWLWVCVAVVGLSACGTTKVDFEKQALIQVKRGLLCSLDGKETSFFTKEQAVNPGQHVVTTNSEGDCRYPVISNVTVSAGLIYQFSADGGVLEVSDAGGRWINRLFRSPNDRRTFVSLEESQRARDEQLIQRQEQQAAARAAERQRKIASLPYIRKVGAQICREWPYSIGHGQISVIEVGYVEGVTNDKVQIRISRAYLKVAPNSSPGGFQSSIIWDDPMNWDLCQ